MMEVKLKVSSMNSECCVVSREIVGSVNSGIALCKL